MYGVLSRAALIAKRLKLDFAMIFGEQTKFAECLSEETLLGMDGSLDGKGCSASHNGESSYQEHARLDEQVHALVTRTPCRALYARCNQAKRLPVCVADLMVLVCV